MGALLRTTLLFVATALAAAGRTYAAYGGVYVATAVFWLWAVDGQRPDRWDLIGAGVCVAGMATILFAPRS